MNVKKVAIGLSGLLGASAGLAAGVGVSLRFVDTIQARRIRRELRTQHGRQSPFDPDIVEELPPVPRRYLQHAIEPGTPIPRRVELEMEGQIRLDPEKEPQSFEATEILSEDRGFLWEVTLTPSSGPGVSGFDYYLDGDGGGRFALLGAIPVARSSGPVVSQSSAGRFRTESIWLPTSLLTQRGATWKQLDDDRATVEVPGGGDDPEITITVGADGELQSVETERIRGEDGTVLPFGGTIAAESTFDGITIPTDTNVGWWFGTDRYEEFFSGTVTNATFF